METNELPKVKYANDLYHNPAIQKPGDKFIVRGKVYTLYSWSGGTIAQHYETLQVWNAKGMRTTVTLQNKPESN